MIIFTLLAVIVILMFHFSRPKEESVLRLLWANQLCLSASNSAAMRGSSIPFATRQFSLQEVDEIHDKIPPVLRVLHENPSFNAWFLAMEYTDPEIRATEFENLAKHSEVTDPRLGYGKMFRLFQDPMIYTAGLNTLKKM